MASVVVSCVDLIAPKTGTPQPCVKYMSVLGRVKQFWGYTSHVSYYHPPPASCDFAALVAQLKDSLSRTLSVYYILAGRLEEAGKGSSSSSVLNCNDSGVSFRVALAPSRLRDWNDLEADCPIVHFLTPHDTFHSHAPLLQIQVTRFQCGSIALGFAICEAVIDGLGISQFIRTWAEIHKDGKISNPPPLFDAELFKPRDPPRVTIPIRDYVADYSVEEFIILESSFSPPQCSTKLFSFAADKVDTLVCEVQDGPYTYGACVTSFEAMSALVWKCMTEARQLADDETTTLIYPISLRGNTKRWEPHVPSNYFGNAVHHACLPARAGDIKSKHVSYGAQLIHQDVQNVNAESMKSVVDWMQIQIEKDMQVLENANVYSGKDINCTNLYAFPMYDANFGWGRPQHFSVGAGPFHGDGVAFMLPTPEGGRNRYLSVSLPQENLHKLSTHPLFSAFATPTEIHLA